MIFFLIIFLSIFLFVVAGSMRKQEKYQELHSIITAEEVSIPRKRWEIKSPIALAMELAQQSGLKGSRPEWMGILTLSALLGIAGGMVFDLGVVGTVAAGGIGLYSPVFYLKWRKHQYYESFRYGLQELTEIGVTIFQSVSDLDALVREGASSKNKVIAHECKEIIRESEVLGKTTLNIMKRRAEISGIPEYLLLAEMTQVAFDVNTSLVKIYSDMNESIKNYFGTEQKILAKTSGMRKVGFALALSPIPIYGFFWDTIQPLLQGGIKLLFYGSVLVTVFGVYVLMRVVRVRV